MEAALEWARGPALILAVTFMTLGLIRHVLLTIWESIRIIMRAGDKEIPYKQVWKTTIRWMLPVDKIQHEPVFSITSIVFHAAIMIVPLFLAGHVVLLAGWLGFSWPTIPNLLADILTIIAIISAVALVAQRFAARATRHLSRPQDYVLPLVVAIPFVTGFLVMHPTWNIFSYEAMLFVHVMSANLVFVLMPITKLSHAVMLPSVQLVSEIGWKWPTDSGSRVGAALGKEGDPV
jgi:nitrate reductase gamma subunit